MKKKMFLSVFSVVLGIVIAVPTMLMASEAETELEEVLPEEGEAEDDSSGVFEASEEQVDAANEVSGASD